MNPAPRLEQSQRLFDRARKVLPGGVSSPVRSFRGVGGTPPFIARAAGPYIWDVDGNQYVDWVMSWGPLIHGHAFPPVLAAISDAASRGTSFGAPTEAEIQLAELVISRVPSVEVIRFVSSGTEAAVSAIRLARGFTGRDLVVKFAGNYHGHADVLLAQAGSGGLTFGTPTSPGVPESVVAATLVMPYNDADALGRVFAEHGGSIAAVIVEPIAGNMGVVPPEPGFLEAIGRLTRESGALFIADEVITGFRVARGGAQETLDFRPDLTVLGKIIGGGLPAAAYGGRRDVMALVSPDGPVYQAGTLSGNPLAMAAGIAALQALDGPEFYASLAAKTNKLRAGLEEAARRASMPVTDNSATGMLTVFMAPGPIRSLAEVEAADTTRFAHFFHAMQRRGIYLPPSQFEAWMVSAAHDEEAIEQTIAAAREAFTELATTSRT